MQKTGWTGGYPNQASSSLFRPRRDLQQQKQAAKQSQRPTMIPVRQPTMPSTSPTMHSRRTASVSPIQEKTAAKHEHMHPIMQSNRGRGERVQGGLTVLVNLLYPQVPIHRYPDPYHSCSTQPAESQSTAYVRVSPSAHATRRLHSIVCIPSIHFVRVS